MGIGNPDRGDDGAGREAARRLAALRLPDVQIVETGGEATAVLARLEKAGAAFLIDACVSGAPAGSVRRIDLVAESLPDARYGLSSHGFGLAEAVALAKRLETLPPRCVLYAIEAKDFGFNTKLSPCVARAVDAVVEALRHDIAAVAQGD